MLNSFQTIRPLAGGGERMAERFSPITSLQSGTQYPQAGSLRITAAEIQTHLEFRQVFQRILSSAEVCRHIQSSLEIYYPGPVSRI